LEPAHNNVNDDLGLIQDMLKSVRDLALLLSEHLILRSDKSTMPEDVRAFFSILSVDEAAAVCAYTMEFGPYKTPNKLNC